MPDQRRSRQTPQQATIRSTRIKVQDYFPVISGREALIREIAPTESTTGQALTDGSDAFFANQQFAGAYWKWARRVIEEAKAVREPNLEGGNSAKLSWFLFAIGHRTVWFAIFVGDRPVESGERVTVEELLEADTIRIDYVGSEPLLVAAEALASAEPKTLRLLEERIGLWSDTPTAMKTRETSLELLDDRWQKAARYFFELDRQTLLGRHTAVIPPDKRRRPLWFPSSLDSVQRVLTASQIMRTREVLGVESAPTVPRPRNSELERSARTILSVLADLHAIVPLTEDELIDAVLGFATGQFWVSDMIGDFRLSTSHGVPDSALVALFMEASILASSPGADSLLDRSDVECEIKARNLWASAAPAFVVCAEVFEEASRDGNPTVGIEPYGWRALDPEFLQERFDSGAARMRYEELRTYTPDALRWTADRIAHRLRTPGTEALPTTLTPDQAAAYPELFYDDFTA